MAIDNRGSLLVTGDESGAIFARILHHRNSKSAHQPPQRDRDGTQFGGGRSSSGNTGDGNATAVASAAAHEGGVLAVSHVDDRPSRISGNEDSDSEPKDEEMLFVSGGQGEDDCSVFFCLSVFPSPSPSPPPFVGSQLVRESVNDWNCYC